MKKSLRLFLTLVLLAAALSVTAFADTIETEDFILTNATHFETEESPYGYEAEDYCILTTTRDLLWINTYYYTSFYGMLEFNLTSVTAEGNTIVDVDASIYISATGETMDYYDWVDAIDNGTTSFDDEPIILAGSTYALHSDSLFYLKFMAITSEEDYTEYHILLDDADGVDSYAAYLDLAETEVSEEVAEETAVEETIVEETTVETGTAVATASTVFVNGEEVAFDAYKINDNNYFKLRDVATVVNGTEKQFSVDWDETAVAISLLSGAEYVSVGGEMTLGDGTAKAYTTTTATLYIDGQLVELTAYNIDNNNYFKLRDLGEAFDFDVSWDGEANAITVDTTASYTAD
ncbi:MAG: hypothetical protein R3Y62_04575 [Eubacteriales bacterium]